MISQYCAQTMSSSCTHCRGTSFVIDIHNGDTICIECGICHNDIALDQFGNPPPDHRTTLSMDTGDDANNIDHNSKTDMCRSFHMRLKLFFDIYSIPEALQEYGHFLIRYAEQYKITLKGNSKDHTCLAIIYLIYENFGILWDIEAVCKDFEIKPKKIIRIANNFNMSSATADGSTKTQLNIFKTAMQMDISIKNIKMDDIDKICNLSRSTKMKTALALYVAVPSRLDDIIKNTCVNKSQLLKAKVELDAVL